MLTGTIIITVYRHNDSKEYYFNYVPMKIVRAVLALLKECCNRKTEMLCNMEDVTDD